MFNEFKNYIIHNNRIWVRPKDISSKGDRGKWGSRGDTVPIPIPFIQVMCQNKMGQKKKKFPERSRT